MDEEGAMSATWRLDAEIFNADFEIPVINVQSILDNAREDCKVVVLVHKPQHGGQSFTLWERYPSIDDEYLNERLERLSSEFHAPCYVQVYERRT